MFLTMLGDLAVFWLYVTLIRYFLHYIFTIIYQAFVHHTGMCASVSLEVERVIEALATRRTQVTFDVAVALDVTVQ